MLIIHSPDLSHVFLFFSTMLVPTKCVVLRLALASGVVKKCFVFSELLLIGVLESWGLMGLQDAASPDRAAVLLLLAK